MLAVKELTHRAVSRVVERHSEVYTAHGGTGNRQRAPSRQSIKAGARTSCQGLEGHFRGCLSQTTREFQSAKLPFGFSWNAQTCIS